MAIVWTRGDVIAKLRRLKRWSQTELASRAGVSVSTVRRTEEDRDVQVENFAAIGGALGLNHSDVISLTLGMLDRPLTEEDRLVAQLTDDERELFFDLLRHPKRAEGFGMLRGFLYAQVGPSKRLA